MAKLIVPKKAYKDEHTSHWHFKMFPGSTVFATCGKFLWHPKEIRISKLKPDEICPLCLGAMEVK